MTARALPALLVLATLAAWAGGAHAQPAAPGDSCATCHLEIGDERLAKPVKD